MSKLTKAERDALAPEQFAVPDKRTLPIHDVDHVRLSWGTVSAAKLTDTERSEARRRILAAADALGVELKPVRLSFVVDGISAMSLNISNDDGHPNKMPFSGILTRIDQPSDEAPHGSNGRLITISSEAAHAALESLLGMAVDYKPNLDGHDPRAKIGLITAATIEGDAIHIEGFIYANDFPDVAAEIRANKDALGFSYEARNLYTNDPDANPVVITECVFTGAAILRKDKAAYHSTSISASKEQDIMDSKEFEAFMKEMKDGLAAVSASVAEVKKGLSEKVDANAHTMSMVEPHAKALESCAAAMEAAGVGADPANGHAAIARKMAGNLRAAGALGKIPHIYRDHDYFVNAAADKGDKDAGAEVAKAIDAATKPLLDKLAAMETKLADVKAAAVKNADEPKRKTLSKEITGLMAKHGLEADADGKVALEKVNEALGKSGLNNTQRMAVKTELHRAGVLD